MLTEYIKTFRGLFLNGIKCIIAPLIFASIVTGMSSAGSMKGLGKTSLRAIIYFEIATAAALVVGRLFANWFRTGAGVQLIHKVDESIAGAAQVHIHTF